MAMSIFDRKSVWVFVLGMTGMLAAHALWLPVAHAEWPSVEEAIETLCDAADGVSCSYEQHSGTYNFGTLSLAPGGTGRIRSQAAYCLIRDGKDATASGTFGDDDDWFQFGAQSRFHLTHAGKDPDGAYRAEGQRLLDLTVFGLTLPNIELQDLAARFPTEKLPGRPARCAKKAKIGKANVCIKFEPGQASPATNYYMTLDTEAYAWELNIATILKENFDVEFPGFQMTLGQDAKFAYLGVTELSGSDLNVNDGLIPGAAGGPNVWEWGVDPQYDPATSRLDVSVPVTTTGAVRASLLLGLHLHGHYTLEESIDVNNPWGYSAYDPDGTYTGGYSASGSAPGGVTSTHLAGSTDLTLGAEVCVDFGWFGVQCGKFRILHFNETGRREPINYVSYEANGNPLYLQWADGSNFTGAAAVHDAILTTCLNGPTIDQPKASLTDPNDIKDFMAAAGAVFEEHYHVCNQNNPPPAAVAQEDPMFHLCDDRGNVYAPIGALAPWSGAEEGR